MKRMMLNDSSKDCCIGDIPPEIAEYASGLRLLYSVPFSYLLPAEEMLPSESMRFFCINETWTNALVDGALSIGRNDKAAIRIDSELFSPTIDCAKSNTKRVRYKKVHKNHNYTMESFALNDKCQSGFIIRSLLTRKWKGLEVTGLNGESVIPILRAEMIASDMLICIFDGVLTTVVISEPKAGIRFGAYENEREVSVKSIKEGAGFGKFIPDKNITLKSNDKGCLDILAAKKDFENILGQSVTPSILAFELMLAAQKAVFTEKGGMTT